MNISMLLRRRLISRDGKCTITLSGNGNSGRSPYGAYIVLDGVTYYNESGSTILEVKKGKSFTLTVRGTDYFSSSQNISVNGATIWYAGDYYYSELYYSADVACVCNGDATIELVGMNNWASAKYGGGAIVTGNISATVTKRYRL